MKNVTQDMVRVIGVAGKIPEKEWPRLSQQVRTAVWEHEQSEEAFGNLPTRKEKIKAWQEIEKVARDLNEGLRDGLVKGGMISHERLVGRKESSAAQEMLQSDLKGVENIVERLGAIISHLEDLKAHPHTADEKIARAGAAKPEQKVWDSYIVSFWQQTKGTPTYTERSEFVEYFRAFDALVHPPPNSHDLPVETIRSRADAAMRWLKE